MYPRTLGDIATWRGLGQGENIIYVLTLDGVEAAPAENLGRFDEFVQVTKITLERMAFVSSGGALSPIGAPSLVLARIPPTNIVCRHGRQTAKATIYPTQSASGDVQGG